MGLLGELFVKLSVDSASMNSSFEAAHNKIDSLANSSLSLGTALTKSVTIPLLTAAAGAIKLSSDVQESENLVNVSMGQMSDEAKKWSQELNSSLGLSEYNLRKTVSTLDAMFSGMGISESASYKLSTSLTMLSEDLASFYNLSQKEAFDKIKSGIVGESEPLKALGVIINETNTQQFALNNGLIKTGQKMTEQQKVIARYGLIMKQTSLAHGDLARTLDSPANKSRILTEEMKKQAIQIGNDLMPAYIKLQESVSGILKVTGGVISKFNGLNEEGKETVLVISGLVVGIGPALVIMASLIKAVKGLGLLFASFTGPVGVVVLAITGLITSLSILYNTNENVRRGLDSAWSFLKVNVSKAAEFIGKTIDGLIEKFEKFRKQYNLFGGGPQGLLKDSMGLSSGSSNQYVIDKQLKYSEEIESQRLRVQKQINSTAAVYDKSDSYKDYLKDVKDMFDKVSDSTVNLTDKNKSLKDSVKSVVDAVRNQTESFSNFVGIFDNVQIEKLSGNRLMTRLKGQVYALEQWRNSLDELKRKGASSSFLNTLAKLGPNEVGNIQSLSKMTGAQIKQYENLYNQKQNIAGEMAAKVVSQETINGNKIDKQINLYITGNNIKSEEDVTKVANAIIKKLKLKGVTP